MRTICVDISKEQGRLNRYFSKCIGAGRAGEVMRHTAFEQLKQVKKDCGFEYIRFHGLFHEEMNVVRRNNDGKLLFNFQYMDLLFDSLLSIGIRPIVELGLMPDIMAKDKKYVFWWKMNISMPEKMDEWYQLVYETAKHFKERYGEEEVAKWYFEVWNEPNHPAFFTESENVDAYLALYEAAARAVKDVSKNFRVGGPSTAGLGFIDEIMEYCEAKDVPLDFISSHQYCVRGAFDADGKSITMIMPVKHLADSFTACGKKVRKKNYPFIITEWSASYSSRDSIHDSYFSAPFILETLKRCENDVDVMSYWVYTDIFEEVTPPNEPFHGGFGLLTVQSVPKPAYYAFHFLNTLADTQLICEDSSSIACRTEKEVQLLFWNNVHPDTKGESNAVFFKKPYPTKVIEDAKICVSGLGKNKEYKVTVQTVGYKMGDCYHAYLENGFGTNMLPKEVETLMEAAKPKQTELTVKSDENGILSATLPQTENQVDFVKIAI